MKKSVLKNFTNFTGRQLCCGFFLIKWQAFWHATLLKRGPSPGFPCEYLEIFKNTYFEVETLENEIYSCFTMSVSHTLLTGKSKESMPKLFYCKRNMVQCKTLIQLFPFWKQKSPHPN